MLKLNQGHTIVVDGVAVWWGRVEKNIATTPKNFLPPHSPKNVPCHLSKYFAMPPLKMFCHLPPNLFATPPQKFRHSNPKNLLTPYLQKVFCQPTPKFFCPNTLPQLLPLLVQFQKEDLGKLSASKGAHNNTIKYLQ